jgi:hypothetical protein
MCLSLKAKMFEFESEEMLIFSTEIGWHKIWVVEISRKRLSLRFWLGIGSCPRPRREGRPTLGGGVRVVPSGTPLTAIPFLITVKLVHPSTITSSPWSSIAVYIWASAAEQALQQPARGWRIIVLLPLVGQEVGELGIFLPPLLLRGVQAAAEIAHGVL